jgi:multidrug efflux pump subunit AcrB
LRLRQAAADGLAPEARVRATQLVFGPYSPFPVAFRVMGTDPTKLREIARSVEEIMRNDPNMRTVNVDWGERVPKLHFVLDQERLQLIGLSPQEAAQQLQFLLNGQTITQVREDIRTVNVVVRSAGPERLDPAKLENFSLTTRNGKRIPLSQIGRVEIQVEIQAEDPLIKRRDRVPTITVRGDNVESTQPPDVSSAIWAKLAPLRKSLPENYRIEMAGSIEEATKANSALAPLFPIMLLLMLAVIIIQVRSFSAMWMVMLTGPLGLIGAVPALLIFQQPFGFNAILGLIGLSGILMRNTLILIGQIHSNQADGLDPYQAIIEATVQRSRPVILTALAAVLAFIPLTNSVFWGSMAYVLIGGTAVGTVLTLAFLPALYAIWFRVRDVDAVRRNQGEQTPPVADSDL